LQPLPTIAEELLPLRVGIDVFAQLIKQRTDVGCRVGGMPDGILCERADVSRKLGFQVAKTGARNVEETQVARVRRA